MLQLFSQCRIWVHLIRIRSSGAVWYKPMDGFRCAIWPNLGSCMKWLSDKVEKRSIESLLPYARNARNHSAEQISQIAASIREWGWTIPIVVDESGGVIAGHARLLAAKKLGLPDLPVMVSSGWGHVAWSLECAASA